MNAEDPAIIAVGTLGAIIGAIIAFPMGMFYARMKRAWADRRGAYAGAKKAHRTAMSYIPASIRYGLGALIAAAFAFIVLLTSNEPAPSAVPASVPSSSPTKAGK